MIEKIFSLIGLGAVFALFPAIIFYAGIFANYFPPYEIKEYFNAFLAQNLNPYLYLALGLFSGVALAFGGNFLRALYLVLLIVMSLTLVPSVGKNVGERLFMRNSVLVVNGQKQSVQIIYKDRHKAYYRTRDNPKIERLDLNANR